MFETADVDKNNLVTEKEWQNFYRVFLVPFRDNCDLSTKYLLNSVEFKGCMEKTKSLKKLKEILDGDETLKANT